MSSNLLVPENTILPLPPKSPELNPVENIWQFMRDNCLSNSVFKSYDDIVEHCCYAWRKLQERPWNDAASTRIEMSTDLMFSRGGWSAHVARLINIAPRCMRMIKGTRSQTQ